MTAAAATVIVYESIISWHADPFASYFQDFVRSEWNKVVKYFQDFEKNANLHCSDDILQFCLRSDWTISELLKTSWMIFDKNLSI